MASLAGISLRETGTQDTLEKEFRLDPLDVGFQFADKKTYSFLKAFYVLSEFFGQLGYLPQDNKALNNACYGAKITKLSRSPWEFVKAITETREKAALWIEGKKDEDGKEVGLPQVVRKANGVFNPIKEMWDLSIKTAYLSKSALFNTYGGISGASLVFGMGWNTFDHLNKLANSPIANLTGEERSKEDYKVVGHMLKVARDASYVALGVLSVLTTFFQFVFAPFVTCALSASSVVFTILSYYHENLGNPKKLN